ncbi:MAG TPA: group III truncated hemoglobin [Microthrixaceae bacterium]|nr:group III truncated hemoglobin [Microthrixaceae bacterium]
MSAPVRNDKGSRPDVCSPEAVGDVVRIFYGAVAQDELLGPVFNDVARVDWSEHLPKLSAFWCRALFGTPGYQGNPFAKHRAVHERAPFTAAHFERWLELFEETVDDGWQGEYAETMKILARNVARVHSGQLIGAPVGPSGAGA